MTDNDGILDSLTESAVISIDGSTAPYSVLGGVTWEVKDSTSSTFWLSNGIKTTSLLKSCRLSPTNSTVKVGPKDSNTMIKVYLGSGGNSNVLLMNQEVEVTNMRNIHTVALMVLLLFTAGIVSASAIERNEPGRNLESVEKTFSVGSEKRGLRATIVTKDSVVEVVHVGEKMQQGSSEGFTNIVARVYIHTLIPDTYDFALSRSGRILWLVVPIAMDGLPSGDRFHAVYPLLRDDATNQYDFIRKQRTVIEDRYGIVRNAISLTGLIRDVSRSMRAMGDSITVKQERMLTDLHIACPEGESAIVSGKLGAEYPFTVEIGLGEDCRFWAKNCEVIHINEQEDPVK